MRIIEEICLYIRVTAPSFCPLSNLPSFQITAQHERLPDNPLYEAENYRSSYPELHEFPLSSFVFCLLVSISATVKDVLCCIIYEKLKGPVLEVIIRCFIGRVTCFTPGARKTSENLL